MTEDEARTKWCPEVRVARCAANMSEFASTNRTVSGGFAEADRCIASDCMMWRWSKDNRFPGPPTQTEDGYCGKAR